MQIISDVHFICFSHISKPRKYGIIRGFNVVAIIDYMDSKHDTFQRAQT